LLGTLDWQVRLHYKENKMRNDKAHGWQLIPVWTVLIIVCWALVGAVAKVIYHLFMLGWELVP
jgi:hypothetical protein